MGYTAGPLSHLDFRWSTIRSKKHPAGYFWDYDRQNSSACAYIWNRAKSVMPQSITDDIESTVSKTGLPRMDRLVGDHDLKASDEFSRVHPQQGFYEVHVDKDRMLLYGDFGPPAALVGSNYAR